MKILIVDDEQLSRGLLLQLLSTHQDCQVIAQAENGKQAMEQFQAYHPEVIFLDIEMPGMNGLEVAACLMQLPNPPLIVFSTAHGHYAVQAFEANAVDYILKPYDAARVKKTIERIHLRLDKKTVEKQNWKSLEMDLAQQGVLHKMVGTPLHKKDKILFDPTEVEYFYAHLAQVTARVHDQDLVMGITLKELIEKLDPHQFAQSHRAYIVNLNQVVKVAPMFYGDCELTLKNPKSPKLPLSRRFAKQLRGRISGW